MLVPCVAACARVQDYDDDLLHAGVLQLSPGTYLVVDETVMTEGKVSARMHCDAHGSELEHRPVLGPFLPIAALLHDLIATHVHPSEAWQHVSGHDRVHGADSFPSASQSSVCYPHSPRLVLSD